MQKVLIFILLFSFAGNRIYSQNLKGSWYMITRAGLYEMEITKDSVKTRKLTPDFQLRKDEYAYPLMKTVSLQDRTLLIIRSPKDSTRYVASSIIHFSEGRYLQSAWNVPDTFASDMESLVNMAEKDTGTHYGYYFYSKNYIDSLHTMKQLDSMSLDEFKNYLTLYIHNSKKDVEELMKYYHGFDVLNYSYQVYTRSLFELGFDPAVTMDEMGAVFKKYQNDPDVKILLKNLEEGQH